MSPHAWRAFSAWLTLRAWRPSPGNRRPSSSHLNTPSGSMSRRIPHHVRMQGNEAESAGGDRHAEAEGKSSAHHRRQPGNRGRRRGSIRPGGRRRRHHLRTVPAPGRAGRFRGKGKGRPGRGDPGGRRGFGRRAGGGPPRRPDAGQAGYPGEQRRALRHRLAGTDHGGGLRSSHQRERAGGLRGRARGGACPGGWRPDHQHRQRLRAARPLPPASACTA